MDRRLFLKGMLGAGAAIILPATDLLMPSKEVIDGAAVRGILTPLHIVQSADMDVDVIYKGIYTEWEYFANFECCIPDGYKVIKCFADDKEIYGSNVTVTFSPVYGNETRRLVFHHFPVAKYSNRIPRITALLERIA